MFVFGYLPGLIMYEYKRQLTRNELIALCFLLYGYLSLFNYSILQISYIQKVLCYNFFCG